MSFQVRGPFILVLVPRSLEEVEGVGVLGSTAVDLNDQVGKSAGTVVHPEASLVVCLGHVGIGKSLAWSHAY